MQSALLASTPSPYRIEGTFAYELDALRRSLADQVIVSTGRCVDGLLDLYNVTRDPAASRLIEDALRDIRFTNSVRADRLRDALVEIDDAALVDHAVAGE
jgi:hypothetical protein